MPPPISDKNTTLVFVQYTNDEEELLRLPVMGFEMAEDDQMYPLIFFPHQLRKGRQIFRLYDGEGRGCFGDGE